jgi:sugar/nucleoside kinase (ribokinase family)
MPVEILCVGHASFDLSVFVDAFPAEDSKCETTELQESGGGPAANAAYLLSAWGVGCGFAGLIGNDRYGQRIREEFQGVGADISLLEMRPGHATPLSIVLINKQNGSRTIVNRKIAGATLRIEEEALQVLAPRILLFDGHELPASLAALRVFPEAISILDAGSWREGTAQLAGQVDYLAASKRFALQATGLSDLSDAGAQRACVSRLRDLYSTIVVVTLGENGLIADDGGGFFHLPAYAARAVDTTAAGDIFHGALAYALAQAWSFLDSLRFASLTASLSVRLAGGRSSIPSLKKVKEEFAHAG